MLDLLKGAAEDRVPMPSHVSYPAHPGELHLLHLQRLRSGPRLARPRSATECWAEEVPRPLGKLESAVADRRLAAMVERYPLPGR